MLEIDVGIGNICLLLLKVSGDKKKMVIDIGRIAISFETDG
jgi:hypothetical protein